MHFPDERLSGEIVVGVAAQGQNGDLFGRYLRRNGQDIPIVLDEGHRLFERPGGLFEVRPRGDLLGQEANIDIPVILQAEPGLELQDSTRGIVDPRLGNGSLLNRPHQCVNDTRQIRRKKDHVNTCLDCLQSGLLGAESSGYPTHGHGVGHDEPLKAHFLPEQVCQDKRR